MTPELGPPIEVVAPHAARVPLVVSSPHSGQIYPPALLGAVQVELGLLRRLEDGPVDRLFGCAPALGAPLLHARFARAYVDPNREAFELDRELFDGPLPAYVNTVSAKARAGLGTIPSRIGGRAIYRAPLGFAEAERRIGLAYWPYHRALEGLLARARAEFGGVLLLDCHSMPSLSAGDAVGEGGIDFALGDRFGHSCSPLVVEQAERVLRRHGFKVARNRPYAGGHITARYGRPEADLHALQIEVRRGLYMDERSLRPHAGRERLLAAIRDLLTALARLTADRLAPGRAAAVGLSTAS
jgi:N-formylglutamate amidohydrolase